MDLFLVYFICFAVGLVFAILSAAVSHFFDSPDDSDPSHAHAEGGIGANDMPGFAATSPTTIASFVTAFGGFGMIFAKFEATRSPFVSVPLALLGGVIIAACVVALFRAIFRVTQSSSESRVSGLIGVSGTIITPIPAGGVGEIAYVDGGTRYTAPVRTEDGSPVASGTTVRITRISGTQFYVSPA
jgi:membrane protein implicated in regulation of membrane protease activity